MNIVDEKSDLLIQEGFTIREAMKRMDKVALGILFIVDGMQKLLGVMTDGDVRRALLAGVELSDTIALAYNKKPYFIREGAYDKEGALCRLFEQRLKAIPIVDTQGKLIAYIADEDPSSIQRTRFRNIDVPVVIMAGGKGVRMAPFTNVLPKPLIPIGDKTILELIINEFSHYGVRDYIFTINYRGEMIKAYFDCIDHDYKIRYLKETHFWGTAGSLSLLPDDFAKTFIVSNCDIIVKADFADVLEFHRKSGAMLTVLSSIQHHKIPYGVIRFVDGGVVNGLEEKPEISFCVNTGVYILESSCLDYIPENQVFHMTNLMESLMKDGKKVVTYPVNESEYIDIGQWEEYRLAVAKLS